MIIVMCVGLYTSRVVLRTLGIEDYGVYNVIGSVVVLFSFLQSEFYLDFLKYIQSSLVHLFVKINNFFLL